MTKRLAMLLLAFCALPVQANDPWLSSVEELGRIHGERLYVRPCGAGERPPECPLVALNGRDHVLQFLMNASGQLTQTLSVYHMLVGERSATVQELVAGAGNPFPPTSLVRPRLLAATNALKQSLGAPDYEDDDGAFWEVLWVRGDTFTKVYLQYDGREVSFATIERHHIPNWKGWGNYCALLGTKLAACAPKPETYARSDFILLQQGTSSSPALYGSRSGYRTSSASMPFPHFRYTYLLSYETPLKDGTRSSVHDIRFKCDKSEFYKSRTAWFTGPFGDGSRRGEWKAGIDEKDEPVVPNSMMEVMMRHACRGRK